MSWAWQLRTAPESPGGVSDQRWAMSESFTSRSDAETWIGEQWRVVRSDGVVAVALTHDDEVVAQPLELPPTEDS